TTSRTAHGRRRSTSRSRTPSASAARTRRSSSGARPDRAMAASLLQRRLHFVVGKGGVGKTTVAAALALLLARRGRRALAVGMDTAGRLGALLGARETGPAAVEVGPRLHVLAVDGRAALEEYLGLVIPVKRLLSSVFSSRIYQYFVAVAPGLKELMTVG